MSIGLHLNKPCCSTLQLIIALTPCPLLIAEGGPGGAEDSASAPDTDSDESFYDSPSTDSDLIVCDLQGRGRTMRVLSSPHHDD